MRAHSKRGSRGCQLAPSPGPLVVVIMLSRVHVRVQRLQPQANHTALLSGHQSIKLVLSVRVTMERHNRAMQLREQGGVGSGGPQLLLSRQHPIEERLEGPQGRLEGQWFQKQQLLPWQQQEQHRWQQPQWKLQLRALQTAAAQ